MIKFKKEKGVSEVIGTLLILTITVILFSSVFYYVATMPPPKSQVYASFQASYSINNEGFANITITNVGGESLNANTTNILFIFTNNSGTFTATHPLSDFIKQLKSGYWTVGQSIFYSSSIDNVHLTYLSGITIYIIDKISNSIIWQDILSGKGVQSLKITGFSYTPVPIKNSGLATFNAFVIYNPSGSIPSVKIDLSSLGLGTPNMTYAGPFQFTYSIIIPQNLKSNVYPVWINATQKVNSTGIINAQPYKAFVNVGTTANIQKIMITSVTASSYDPSHGSNDNLYISIYSTSYQTETFSLLFIDNYKKYTANITANMTFGSTGNRFTINSYESLSISVTWNNVGGIGAAAGLHKLTIEAVNVVPYVQNISYTLNITVLPKILLVNDDNAPLGSSQDVLNFYQTMFSYTGYQVDTQTISPTQVPIVKGYDLVVWVTGYSSVGITQIQANFIINNLYNRGVSLLLISGSSSTYKNLSAYLGITTYKPIGSNSALNATASKIENINISQVANITSTPYITSVLALYGNGWVSFLNTTGKPSYPIGIFQNHTQTGNKIIVLGFEFSRLYVYQQDYIMNKMMLWLSNITIKSGIDLALSDILISNYAPLFMQNVNISIVVSNYSPITLTNVPLEILIDNEPLNNVPLVYINSIAGNGAYYIYNTTWQATTPGTHTVTAIVNPYHTITEVNYANNEQAAIIKNVIDVKFSTLVIWAHTSQETKNITAVTNALNSTGMIYKFINYYESPNSAPPKNLSQIIVGYNLVIIDFNNTGNLTTPLSTAIHKFLVNANATKYPYSMLLLGENAGSAIRLNNTIMGDLEISNIKINYVNNNNPVPTTLYGIDYNGPGLGLGFFGTNITRGYGLEYRFTKTNTTLTSNNPESMAILSTSNVAPFNTPFNTAAPKSGTAILENISGVMVGIVPLDYDNIIGLFQNHTVNSPYSPSLSSSSLLSYSAPSSAKYAQNFFMLNLALSFRFTINKTIPEILSSDIYISSKIVTLNNYYVINGIIRNLGEIASSVVLQSYEETSMFNTQTIYLPPTSATPFQVLWKPSYASSPNPEYLRFLLINSNLIKLPTQEAIIPQTVYFFYDNFSNGGSNWQHYDTVFGYAGVQRYGSGASYYYSEEPYSVFGSVANLFSSPIGTPSYYKYYSQYWNLYSNPYGITGGYSLGISYNVNQWPLNNYNNLIQGWGSYSLTTNYISIKGATSIIVELYANFQLSLGGEGVVLFVAHDNGNWHWVPPTQGYPGNINDSFLSGYGNYYNGHYYIYPSGGDLIPAFTMLSSGWQYYSFNLADAYEIKTPISQWQNIALDFVFGYNRGYYGNIYGNDGFYMDDIKVIETGPITPNSGAINSGTLGDTWHISTLSSGTLTYTGFVNNLTNVNNQDNYYEIDNLESIPISLSNAISANMNFLTEYQIFARFAYAKDPIDVPDGFRLYVGVQTANGIVWHQIDTRWAGEAGYSNTNVGPPASLLNASEIASTYYTNMGAFSSIPGSNISLAGYVGQTILLKFEVNGDTPDLYYGFTGSYEDVFTYSEEPTTNMFVFITNVIVQGYSLYSPIQVQSTWL